MPSGQHERTNDMHKGEAKSGGPAKWIIGFIFIALLVALALFAT